MEEVGESEANWLDSLGEELVRELLDDNIPVFVSPKVKEPEPDTSSESMINKLNSTVHSGPTSGDIQSAQPVTFQSGESDGHGGSRPMYVHEAFLLRWKSVLVLVRCWLSIFTFIWLSICYSSFSFSLPEKGLGKMESRYTLRIKTSGNGLADDGYKWRKYGQKSIKNSPNPRFFLVSHKNLLLKMLIIH